MDLSPGFGMEPSLPHGELVSDDDFYGLIGRSPVMLELFHQIRLLASLEAPVLVEGEAGVGKGRVARLLHRLSPREAAPLICLQADEISPALFAGELFGHAEDAFAGALGAAAGAAVAADGGTLLIEEVAELVPENQGEVARFLVRREVVPVGGRVGRRVDVRVICTATRGPGEEILRLQEEISSHLEVFTLRVPPLRDRREDLPLLARHFLRCFTRQYAKEIAGIDPRALEGLENRRWEGNVRQLAEEMERAVILTPVGEPLGPEAFCRGA